MTETTNIPCLPLKPETDALYPRTTVHYNEKMNAVEVGFYGPDHGVIHILSLDRAACLAHLLADNVNLARINAIGEPEHQFMVQRIMTGVRTSIAQTDRLLAQNIADESPADWRTQGDGHYAEPGQSVFVGHEAEINAALEAEYATIPRQAEGA